MKISSRRLESLPKYLFSELEDIRDQNRRAGIEILDLSIGDPDLPTPEPVVTALADAARDPVNHQYPSGRGLGSLRRRVAEWFQGRFGVELDPDSEVLCLIGSKEGLAHLPLAVCDPGDNVLVPDPGYPVYNSASILAGAKPVVVPLKESEGFLLDVESGTAGCGGARLCFINYPNNPTGAAAGLDYYERVVNAALKDQLLICSDAAYSEITYGDSPSPSILQVERAKEVAIELHSFSKTFNMTGWRIAFAAGNSEVLRCLGAVKTNIDSGAFQAVQRAAIKALDLGPSDLDERRETYRRRMELVVSDLKEMKCDVYPPQGAFYVWAKVPRGYSSLEFTTEVLRRTGVSVAPGTGFGAAGEGYFRISLTVPEEDLRKAMVRLKEIDLWRAQEERIMS